MKARNIAYWITTIVLAFCILSGGAAETVHYQANVEGIIVRLGYRRLPAAMRTKEFESVFFNRAVLFLDYMFVHRLRGIEGKDRQSVERGPCPL